jgi:arginase
VAIVITADWFLLGAPWDCSGSGRGEQAAPAALRAAGLSAMVDRDLGDAACTIDGVERDAHTGVLALPETVRAAHALTETLERALRDLTGLRPLVVGGDCSILLGILPALRRTAGPVGLWFLDGHPDYSDGPGSETGETADMELAILTGDGPEPLTALAGAVPMVPASAVVMLGHRTSDLDKASARELARVPAALPRIDADAIAADPAAAGLRAASLKPEPDRPMWLHLDVDVLDGEVLPAVSYPQPGGLDWDQLEAVMAPLAQSRRLVGVSVADFRPDLDPTGEHAARVCDLLERLLP